jgi:cytochrome c553
MMDVVEPASVGRRKRRWAWTLAAALLLSGAQPLLASDFDTDLARIDDALRKNPSRVFPHALASCRSRRDAAVRLFDTGQIARAERSLKYCFQMLQISEVEEVAVVEGPSLEEIQARAAREVEQALVLSPDLENGLKVYRDCALCHKPEGWGLESGSVPNIAGQHRRVVIKQLADMRAGYRENVIMAPYSSVESIGGTQSIADVAGYIDTLEMTVASGKGSGEDLELGGGLYRENCARCHGAQGEGDDAAFVPRIQAQHYRYLLRQLESIREGRRQNANPEMAAQIRGLDEREIQAVLDYVSRLEPPEDLRAPPDWHNPDFAK